MAVATVSNEKILYSFIFLINLAEKQYVYLKLNFIF